MPRARRTPRWLLRGSGSATAVPVLVFSPAVHDPRLRLDLGRLGLGGADGDGAQPGPRRRDLILLNAVGGDASSFSVVGGTCAIGTVLFEAATCTISVQFAPGSAGIKTAQVQIASTGSFPPVLTLTGVGLAGPNPSLELVTPLPLPSAPPGRVAVAAVDGASLSSSGSGVVTVSAIGVSGTYGIDSTTCPAACHSRCLPAPTARSRQLPADRRRRLRRHAQHHQRCRPGGARSGAQRQRRGQGGHQQRRLHHRRLARPGRSAALDDGPDRRGVARRPAEAAWAGSPKTTTTEEPLN